MMDYNNCPGCDAEGEKANKDPNDPLYYCPNHECGVISFEAKDPFEQ